MSALDQLIAAFYLMLKNVYGITECYPFLTADDVGSLDKVALIIKLRQMSCPDGWAFDDIPVPNGTLGVERYNEHVHRWIEAYRTSVQPTPQLSLIKAKAWADSMKLANTLFDNTP